MSGMTDGRSRRIADDIHLIFMGRAIERYYGPDALEALLAWKHRKIRETWRRRAAESGRSDAAYLECLFSPDAHEFEVIESSPTRLEVTVRDCVHARTFRSYGAADLGERLICAGDHAVVEGFNPQMRLDRASTCMTGDCCPFVFTVTPGSPRPRR